MLGAAASAAALVPAPGHAEGDRDEPAKGKSKKRIMVVGASAMHGALGREIEQALDAAGYEVTRVTRGSSGLSRPDFFNWPKEAKRTYAKFEPHATVVNFGGNDAQGLKMPEGHDPPWIRWPEKGWSAEYAKRVVAFANTIAPRGEHIFWLGMPAMESETFDQRILKINRIVTSSLQGRPGAHFVDMRKILSRKGERCSDSIVAGGKTIHVREPDGVHITRGGGRHVASKLLPMLDEALEREPEPPVPLPSLLRLQFTPRAR